MLLTDEILEDYQKTKLVCEAVYKYIKKNSNKTDDTQVLRQWAQEYLENTLSRILKETGQVYNITTPVLVSPDNCVGNYVTDPEDTTTWESFKELSLTTPQVIKIEFGLKKNKSTIEFGETFVRHPTGESTTESKRYTSLIQKLENLPKKLIKTVKGEQDETQKEAKLLLLNDDIRQFIEAECTKFNCAAVENTISYKDPYHTDDPLELESMEAQIILGFKRKFSEDEEWITIDNPCCEIEDGDVYNLDIRIVEERDTPLTYNGKVYKEYEHVYGDYPESQLHRLSGAIYKLKTASGREFYSRLKNRYGHSKFLKQVEVKCAKDRLGFKDTNLHNLLTEYKTKYIKTIDNRRFPVFMKKCTVYYKDGELHLI